MLTGVPRRGPGARAQRRIEARQGAWNEFIVALTLTTGSSVMPLTVRLDSFIGQYTVDWQHLFGASVVATIPVLVLFALIERRVVGGLTAGSVK